MMKRVSCCLPALLLCAACFTAFGASSAAETVAAVVVGFDYGGEFRHGADPFSIPFFADEGGYHLGVFSGSHTVGFMDVTENRGVG